jgi:2-iminobutanoate/2-iminopropanoate deaminase
MSKKIIIKPAKSAPAVGPYNHAVRVGNLLFCSGQIPLDPVSGTVVSGDIKAQAERALENVKAILEDQKLTFANVVKSTVFLTSMADFAAMNEVYAKYFTADYPARSTVQVAGLPKGANVEIEVVAHFDAS